VRLDQGGDTVSEGQAYAMLLAVATGDRDRFARVWRWTQTHLQRPDGLLSYRWRAGAVADPQPAADADLDAARALLLAARRFGRPAYRRAALRIGRGILAQETTTVGGRLVLVAGPWARDRAVVDPSYDAPRALAALAAASGDGRWRRLEESGTAIVSRLQGHRSGLAPDWAVAQPGGGAAPIGTPAQPGAQARYGFDAARIPLRLAEACDPATRREAAAPWRTLGRLSSGTLPAVLDLGGTPLAHYEHPAALVGAAAAARAAGRADRTAELLDRAQRLDARSPTYYGAALVALGRVVLQSHLLGGCRGGRGG
jgi:endoglucanase